jgi:hypothetical protein
MKKHKTLARRLPDRQVLQSQFPFCDYGAAQRDVFLAAVGYILSPPSWPPGGCVAAASSRALWRGQRGLVAPAAGGPAQGEGEPGAGDQPGGYLRGEAGQPGGLGY